LKICWRSVERAAEAVSYALMGQAAEVDASAVAAARAPCSLAPEPTAASEALTACRAGFKGVMICTLLAPWLSFIEICIARAMQIPPATETSRTYMELATYIPTIMKVFVVCI